MSQYHHGNLRNALIIAAAELIEKQGVNALSMIDVSRRAGVSNAAPYRHFKDKDALLEAVCQVSFMALTQASEIAASSLESGTSEHIIALGKAYIEFVLEHPEFYDLMWGEQGIRAMASDPSELKSSGFYLLVASMQLWCERAEIAKFDAVSLSTQMWATVHGLSALAMNKHLEEFIPGVDVYSLLENVTTNFLAGLLSPR